MTSGATAVLVFPGRRVQDLLVAYEKALVDSGFEIKQHDWTGQYYVHKAILGSKAKAYLVRRIVPFGELTKSGNRLGAEAQIYPSGNEAVLRVAIVPYMELFNKAEVAFLTQGVFEKIVDDDWSVEKLHEVLNHMAAMGFAGQIPVRP
jgi:hypothetical protein